MSLWTIEYALAEGYRPETFSLLPEERIDIDPPDDLAFARGVYA